MEKKERARLPLKKILLLALPVAVLAALAVTAKALFWHSAPTTAVEEGAPVAQNQTIRLYEGVPYDGTFAASGAGGPLTFALRTEPKAGSVTIGEGTASFRYIPKEGKTGADHFTFVAIDGEGRVSPPAVVSVEILHRKSGVTYEDMGDSTVQTAAIRLAEEGIFTGTRVGDAYFFEPEKEVSRGEFLTMAMKATGREILTGVTATGFSDDASIPLWAKGACASALRLGVLDAAVPTFGADAAVTVGEAAVWLDRMIGLTDVQSAADDTQQAVANLTSVGVCIGQTTVAKGVTRAEAAQLLSGVMNAEASAPAGFWSFLTE